MSGLKYDSDFVKAVAARGLPPPHEPAKTVAELRQSIEGGLSAAGIMTAPKPESVQEEVIIVKSFDGAEIKVTRFATRETISSSEPSPAVLYVHGGGLVAGSVAIFSSMVSSWAFGSQLPFFAVEYRLAPDFPAPHGLEDTFAALKYVSEHAAELNIDATKICLLGDSAGGGLAAATALLARDREFSPPVAKQILVYPMLDDSTELAPDDPREKLLLWHSSDNVLGWDAYLGEGKRGKADADIPPYAVPARAKTLRGLPPTYIEVGTLDLFRDEDIAFAARLTKDDVEVELHVWPGLPHGFEGVPETRWFERAMSSRLDALKRIGT